MLNWKASSSLSIHNIGKYLGFPLLSGRVKYSDFSYIVDKINSRLAGWKRKLLSRAGPVTLAKSVLTSMPVYSMHNLWILEGICDHIDSCVKQFIWGGKGSHRVRWSKVSQPIHKGGLGLRRARPVNIAMLGKHVWELIHKPDKLWVRLLSSKYLTNSDILHTQHYKGASYTWKSITKAAAAALSNGYIYRVGRGNISLWYERWLHKGRMCDRLPFIHIQDTAMRISDVCHDGIWNFEQIATLLPIDVRLEMQSIFTNDNFDDLIIWEPATNGANSTKSPYAWLIQQTEMVLDSPITWSWVWKLRLPENVKHFAWLVMHEGLPCNVGRVIHHMTTDSSCQRCGAPHETILHTLRDCPSAIRVWNILCFQSSQGFYDPDSMNWFKTHTTGERGQLFVLTC